MHVVNRCLKSVLLSISCQDPSRQGICPPVCKGTHQTQQHAGGKDISSSAASSASSLIYHLC